MRNFKRRIKKIEEDIAHDEPLTIIVQNPIPGMKGEPVPGEPNTIKIRVSVPKKRTKKW
jgi:hypothetical protein